MIDRLLQPLHLWTLVCFAAVVGAPLSSEAVCHGPWQRLPEAGRELIHPASLVVLGASALPPILLAPTGGDHELRRFAQTDLGGSYNPESVSVVTPYVVLGATGAFYLTGLVLDDCQIQRTSSAMVQGLVGTVAVVGLGKWVSGRGWPNGGRDPNAPDRLDHPEDAQDFRPFQQGLGAFPSGHTAVMFAAAAAFRASTPEAGIFRYAGYPFAAAVGFGMWWGDHHWASDVLSGALLGEAIGSASGRAFQPDEEASVEVMVLPLVEGGAFIAYGRF